MDKGIFRKISGEIPKGILDEISGCINRTIP